MPKETITFQVTADFHSKQDVLGFTVITAQRIQSILQSCSEILNHDLQASVTSWIGDKQPDKAVIVTASGQQDPINLMQQVLEEFVNELKSKQPPAEGEQKKDDEPTAEPGERSFQA